MPATRNRGVTRGLGVRARGGIPVFTGCIPITAAPGDWVVSLEQGPFAVLGGQAFRQLFRVTRSG